MCIYFFYVCWKFKPQQFAAENNKIISAVVIISYTYVFKLWDLQLHLKYASLKFLYNEDLTQKWEITLACSIFLGRLYVDATHFKHQGKEVLHNFII